ncbi:MAG: right-handed parallel beta-helix repeat-containing protein [Caldilineaceae bacterium]|nr:right-handed parallel beta-helix repeat-containing protein [Caldilineaceae bacterium]
MSRYPHARAVPAFIAILLALMGGMFAYSRAQAQDSTVTVSPAALNGWEVAAPTAGSTVAFVTGPGKPPLGTGSVYVATNAAGTFMLGTRTYAGTRLSQITRLSYYTYRSPDDPDNRPIVTLQFDIDFDSTDGNTQPQGRLVFAPKRTGTPDPMDTWQKWDALAWDAVWYVTAAPSDHDDCTTREPCTWYSLLKHFPNAAIHPTGGQLLFYASNPGLSTVPANADALTVGISQQNTTYDFEPAPPCKETCYVDGVNGNDTFSGNSPERALRTIQAAVDRVQSGGTVIVAGAVYPESVTVTRPLTLRGPNADVCANDAKDPALPATQRAAEATLAPDASPALTLAAGVDNVTIAGFRFGAPASAGIVADDAPAPGFESIRITNNLFDQVAGPAIDSDRAARTSWEISCNRMLAATDVQPALVALVAGETRSLAASGNYFDGSGSTDSTALLLDNAVDTTVTANAFDAFGDAAIRVRDGATNLLIENNTLRNNVLGVHLLATGATPLATVSVQYNGFDDMGQAAVRLETPPGEDTGAVSELLICNNHMVQDAGRMANGSALIDLRLAPLPEQSHGLITVRENTVELSGETSGGAVHAIRAAGALGTLAIKGNILGGGNVGGAGDAGQPASSAIYLQSQDAVDGAIPGSAVISITLNRLGGFENGIAVFDPVAGVDGGLAADAQVTATGNAIAGNAQFGARTGAGAPLRAPGNWWGDASGPGEIGPGAGDRITENVDYCPWLDALPPDGQAVGPVQNVDTGSYFCAINEAVNAAETLDGHTVRAAPGLYVEQVAITKSVTVTGSGAGQSIVHAPETLPPAASVDSAIVTVAGAEVAAEITGFTIAGPGPAGVCGSIRAGIFVHSGAGASIHDNEIVDIRDEPMTGCQQGIAIVVGSAALQTTGAAEIYDNVLTGYQKGAIAVSGAGSTATIRANQITGAGPTTLLVQNGIQVASGATATITGNRVAGHSFTPFSLVSTGILLFKADADTAGNTLEENQVGLYLVDSSGSHDANSVRATAEGTRSPIYWGIIVDAPPPDRIPQPGDFAVKRAAALQLATVSDVRGVQTVTVTNNEIESDNSAGGVGLQADGGYGVLDIDLTATNNFVRNWQRGIYVVQCSSNCSGAGYTAAIFRHNSITGNESGFNNGNAIGLGVEANENWWGSDTGPAAPDNPGGAGDALSGDAVYSPWLCAGTDSDPAPGFQPDAASLCGLAARLIFDEQPADAIENVTLSPQPAVRAVDAAGNPAPGFVGPVTLAIAPAGTASLAGQTTVMAARGTAVFGDVAFTDIAGGVALLASSPGLPPLSGVPLDVVPQTAELTVRVVVDGMAPGDGWSVTGAWGTAEIDAGGGEVLFADVRANRPQGVAVAAKSGYTARVECSDGSRGDTAVTLSLGYQTSTLCTFTMTAQPASVTVRKQVSGQAPTSTWRFAGDLGDFELPAGGGDLRFAPAAGVVQIAEEPKPGYDTAVACSNGAAGAQSALLALAPGENVSCTFAATEQPSGASLRKTVGLAPGECATSSVIAVPAGTTVYYCYTVTNSGDAPLATHALSDSKFGDIIPALAHPLAPGESLSTVDLGYVISDTAQATAETSAIWTATAPEGAQAQDSAAAAVNVLRPAIDASLTLLDDKGHCTTDPVVNVDEGSTLPFCLTIRNTGEVALNRHLVLIDELNLATILDRVIEPGVTEHFLASEIAGLGSITATATTTYTASITSTNAPAVANRHNVVYPAPELFVAVDRAALAVWVEPIVGAGQENRIFLPSVVR